MASVNPAILSKVWLQRGKRSLVPAEGHSMEPLIRSGMQLEVQPCSYREVQPGDVAIFHQNGTLVAHRVIIKINQKGKIYFVHKGDNSHSVQEVPSECLIGKVVQIEMSDGTINLEQGYWRLVNYCMGFYWTGFWKILRLEGRKEISPGSLFYFPFYSFNKHFLRLIVRFGYWSKQGVNKEPSWSRLARACIAPSPILPLRLPTGDMEWERFLKKACAQNIQRLCYRSLKHHRKKVPANIISRLARSSHAVGFRNLKIIAEAANLVKALEKVGIEVILLKGVAIHASKIYSNPAQRNMADIDILVKKQDLPRIEATLRDLGYIPYDNFKENDLSMEWNRRYSIEITYHKPGLKNQMVDIHWSIDKSLYIPIQELWQRSRKVNQNGVEITVPSPEDMLLHLSIHAVFHHSLDIDLLHWADFARVTQLSLNWSQIISHAYKYRIERVLYIAFYLSQKFAGAQIPPNVLTKLQQACPRLLIWWLEKQTGLMQFQRPIFATWRCLWFIRGWRGKSRYLGSVLFRTLSVIFPLKEDLALLYHFNSGSWCAYLKYFLIHQKYIWGKALMKRVINLKR